MNDYTNLCYILSEKVLAKDWNAPDEDEAWKELEQDNPIRTGRDDH